MFELLEKHYFYEFQRRDQLDRQSSFVATLLSLGVGLVVFNSQFLVADSRLATYLVQLTLIEVSLLLFAASFLLNALGNTYTTVTEFAGAFQAYEDMKSKESVDLIYSEAEKWIKEDFCRNYALAVAENTKVNNRKGLYIMRATKLGMFSIGIGLVIGAVGVLTFELK